MIAPASDPFAALAHGLETEIRGVTAELTQFPSGAAMLDVRRSDGRAFVLDYTPAHGYAVDEVRADDTLVTGYRFAYPDFEPAAEKLRDLVASQSSDVQPAPPVALNLVVIQSRNLAAAKQFYEHLGLVLRLERHGRGPEHYSAEVGSSVFELYPCPTDAAGPTGGGVRIGFVVPSLERSIRLLRQQSVKVLHEPHDSPWGRRAVVEDPDGNRIELTQQS